MNYRQLGCSDLKVSEISLGSWLTYGVGIDAERTRQCVHAALDAGINFFDTSNIYGLGAAETVLGETLHGMKRSNYILATKLFFPMTPTDSGLSAPQIHKQLDASLKRLGTDYIDLYQCHRYDPSTPLEETMSALTEVVRAGKVRWIGFSEWSAEQICASLKISNIAQFVSSQPQYSMLWRKPESEILPLCAKNGISQIVWSPLGQGVLTGKYKPGAEPPADSRALSPEMGGFIHRHLTPQKLSHVEQLRPLAHSAGLSMAQLALAWVLRQSNVASAIIGATKPEQVADNAAASGQSLSPDIVRAIDGIFPLGA